MSLPRPIIRVLAHFEPLFTAPTWKKVVILLVGTVLACPVPDRCIVLFFHFTVSLSSRVFLSY
jgi:hypothetical protein